MKTMNNRIGGDYSVSTTNKNQRKVNPLTQTDSVPNIRLSVEQGIWQNFTCAFDESLGTHLHGMVNSGPLVISFYSPDWKSYGQRHLESLKDVFRDIRESGGNILVFTTENLDQIKNRVGEENLPFTMLHDANNRIAQLFGLYSPFDAVWDKIAGIDEDVPFPGTFVILKNKQIYYDFTDLEFSRVLEKKPLMVIIKQAGWTKNKLISRQKGPE
ncbi:redoxin domain-containing protein [Telluribacter humicola]|uniref:redoxin domain-containing protein n=1 Tax=Telluribacter humicola TaxID=1720261 RepID=UPI001A965984|nr:redoxin domain-containing protein [Telluribacter humicola]